jgi:small-conductance mechanosensitive channel
MRRFPTINLKAILMIAGILLLIGGPLLLHAEDEPTGLSEKQRQALETLQNLVSLQENLEQDIEQLNKQIAEAKSDSQKQSLSESLAKLESDLDATEKNLENISAGIDLSALRDEEETKFDIQEELFGLLKPAIDEMKDMTSHIRQKSDLKERIAYYDERLKVIESALRNANNLLQQSESEDIKASLSGLATDWEKKRAFMQSELESAQLQLNELLASEASITEASQSYLKSFFQKRGLYLIEALGVVLLIVLLSRFSLNLMRRYMPGFKKKHRSFRTRLLELIHRIVTIFLVIMGPMVVFYVVEDWVLFSLSILLLLGIAWTLRQALPRYWHQIQLFLNIGSVREGERIEMDGLPWLVEQINVFCTLVNPTADLKQRVPIDDLVDLKSRPGKPDEPWFACKLDDWVILSDGVRGKVIGISQEMVQLVERGGAQKTYVTGDFLAASPRNLSTNFRLKEILGISYNLQQQSTGEIPEILQAHIQKQIEAEGYADQLLNLRVEFALANSSSLDLVVIADFAGELGDLYNRLRRAIQRWCVDACTENGWEIPFPQMTLSGGISLPEQ